MDFLLDLLQGLGIAAAIGIRPFLPVLLVGVLASFDAGIDFGGTDFSFLEAWPLLLGALIGTVAMTLTVQRAGDDSLDAGAAFAILAVVAVALGALEAAGSLADREHPIWPGLLVGAGAALLAMVVVRALLARVRKRLPEGERGFLGMYAETAALVTAGLSVLFPPLALLVLGGLIWLGLSGRKREERKYAGLRILR